MERYHEVVCEALHYVCAKNAVAQDIPTDAKLAFFNETRRATRQPNKQATGVRAVFAVHVRCPHGLSRLFYPIACSTLLFSVVARSASLLSSPP